MKTTRLNHICFFTIITIWLLGGCTGTPPPTNTSVIPPVGTSTNTPTPSESTAPVDAENTATPTLPTATAPPAALQVNGYSISFEEFEHKKNILSASQFAEQISDEESTQLILDEIINQVLLAQSADAAGFQVTDEILQSELQHIIEKAGGNDAFMIWLGQMGYTQESFSADLRRSMSAAWMRDQITSSIPETADQVHAHQILLYNFDEAQEVLRQLESGASFDSLLRIYEPISLGELGWFPKNYLLISGVEQAAFELNPGEYSNIIETELGFHIIQVVARDNNRPLAPEVKFSLKEKLLQDWLAEKKQQSDILISMP